MTGPSPVAAIDPTGAMLLLGAAVVRGLQNYIDLFITQIHDANK